jgi:hypothetical protein
MLPSVIAPQIQAPAQFFVERTHNPSTLGEKRRHSDATIAGCVS